MFNEVTPKSNDPSFLAKNSKSVYESLPPGATWVLQGWMFLDKKFWQPAAMKAFLEGCNFLYLKIFSYLFFDPIYKTGPPIGKILVLDLFAEREPFWNQTDSFYGQPYIWCMLGNFGGDTGWYGNIPDIRERQRYI